MSGKHPARTGLRDSVEQCGPVGVVAEHETAVVAAPAAITPQQHPAGTETRTAGAEPLHPGGTVGTRRRDDEFAGVVTGRCHIQHGFGGEHRHPGVAVDFSQWHRRAMQQDPLVGMRGQGRQHPLGFAQCIAEQDGSTALGGVLLHQRNIAAATWSRSGQR